MNPTLLAYLYLTGAIVGEIVGTAFLQKSEQFTKPGPTLIMVVLYAITFFCLSHALKGMPLGIAYAIWGGVGIVFTAIISVVVFKQSLDMPAIIGIALIVAGTVIMNVFSKTATH